MLILFLLIHALINKIPFACMSVILVIGGFRTSFHFFSKYCPERLCFRSWLEGPQSITEILIIYCLVRPGQASAPPGPFVLRVRAGHVVCRPAAPGVGPYLAHTRQMPARHEEVLLRRRQGYCTCTCVRIAGAKLRRPLGVARGPGSTVPGGRRGTRRGSRGAPAITAACAGRALVSRAGSRRKGPI